MTVDAEHGAGRTSLGRSCGTSAYAMPSEQTASTMSLACESESDETAWEREDAMISHQHEHEHAAAKARRQQMERQISAARRAAE